MRQSIIQESGFVMGVIPQEACSVIVVFVLEATHVMEQSPKRWVLWWEQ